MVRESLVTMIFGVRGEGKTFAAKKRVSAFPRYVIFDTLGQYSDMGIICEDVPEFKKLFAEVYNKQSMRIVFQPVNPQDVFEEICEYVYDCGNLCFLAEEVGMFVSPTSMGWNLANIIQRGRHKNIDVLAVNQRPFGIPRILTSQAKEIISFKQREPRDIDYFREFIGERAEEILTLPQYHFLRWCADGNTITTGKY